MSIDYFEVKNCHKGPNKFRKKMTNFKFLRKSLFQNFQRILKENKQKNRQKAKNFFREGPAR